jgi:hypothetical protein
MEKLSVRFTVTKPPPHKGYPQTDVFRRATWERDGKLESIVARGPAGTPTDELDALLMKRAGSMKD